MKNYASTVGVSVRTSKATSPNNIDISNFTLTNDFLSVYEFTQNTGIRMIFDINAILRNDDGSWNSENAEELIDFARSNEMEID